MNIAIILSGGVGSRMESSIPKQYIEVKGKPVIWYCLKTFVEDDSTDAIVIGVADNWKDYVIDLMSSFRTVKPVYFSKPGDTRQMTIFNALKVIESSNYSKDDIVIVHDAARPLVSHDMIVKCYAECANADAILPVIPVKDTLYKSLDGKTIDSLLDRNTIWAGQAPEAFRFGPYLEAHEHMPYKELLKINGSTEIAYKSGLKCKMIKGDPKNFKITTQEDLSNFKMIVTDESL